jgi:beta-glucosidase
MLKFPKKFFWGTATSSHQTEGGNTNNDWWEAEQGTGRYPVRLKYKSGMACDSYNRYEEDFDLAKTMNNNAHRFSIEWSRVEPEEGRFDEEAIEHYRKVLQALHARGLEPFVTLHHFSNPIWFAKMGGWENKKSPEYFERYARKIAEELGDQVTYWVTINEPIITISQGYLRGVWPPFRRLYLFRWLKSLSNMAEAHKRAYRILHSADSSVMVASSQAINRYEPAHHGVLGVLEALVIPPAKILKDLWFIRKTKDQNDFIGIQYYSRYKFSFTRGFFHDEEKERNDFGWEIYPEGLYRVIMDIYRKYKKPIYITENGVADADDDQRPEFIKKHLRWLYRAIEEGADVGGYFYWSLLDNFEWAEGFTQRFGLVEVDFDTFERKLRPSGKLYGEICKKNGLD